MKHLLSLTVLSAVMFLASCGGADKEAERKKREADSLAKLEQARQDSMKLANAPKDIITTAKADLQFSTLISLLDKAGLTATLADTAKNYTVFAPTNAAFEALGEKVLADLQDPKNVDKLKATLLLHVLDGKKMAADVTEASELATLNGKNVAVTKSEAGTKIANATITTADVDCKNGVIHIIDAVISTDAKKGNTSSGKGNSGKGNTSTTTTTTTNKTGNETVDKTNDKLSGKGGNTVEEQTNNKLTGKGNATIEDKTNSKLGGKK
jgi:uncharacterized surface protein with fasciclin (FAS1) repeats